MKWLERSLLCVSLMSMIFAASVIAQDITAQVKLISTSSFTNAAALLRSSSGSDFAVLPTPNILNQFLICDMQKPVALSEIALSIPSECGVTEGELVVYAGENILQWQKVASSIKKDGDRYVIALQANAAQYFKLVFGTQVRGRPLKVSSLSFIRSDALATQEIRNVRVPEDARQSNEVVIEYETAQPSITYVVYSSNFDYMYTSKMDSVYSEVTPKTLHRVVLRGLVPKATYVYQILAKDINEKQYQTRSLYFSTR